MSVYQEINFKPHILDFQIIYQGLLVIQIFILQILFLNDLFIIVFAYEFIKILFIYHLLNLIFFQ